jgi:hypothetical protein
MADLWGEKVTGILIRKSRGHLYLWVMEESGWYLKGFRDPSPEILI